MAKRTRKERYVLLGQYLEENAEAVAEALAAAEIRHYTTRASAITQTLFMGEWGVRIFVEQQDKDRAATIARGIVDT